MNRFLRKLRGAIGVGVTWAVLWALIALVIGLVIGVLDPDSIDPGESPPAMAAIVGAVGFICGLLFSAILALAEDRKTLRDLSPLRAALWGAIGSAALPLLTGMQDSVALNTVPLGVLFASGSVMIARRSALHEGDEQQLLAADAE
jgi:hypothetical protein